MVMCFSSESVLLSSGIFLIVSNSIVDIVVGLDWHRLSQVTLLDSRFVISLVNVSFNIIQLSELVVACLS